MVLKLYVDMMSQPSRALVLFCRLNSIPFEVVSIRIASGEHRSPAFKAVNPMMQVPAMDDNGFLLAESHAILRYLCTTRRVPDHWYPTDPRERARVDSVLDWHHGNLRRGGSGTLFYNVMAPLLGGPPVPEETKKETLSLLHKSLGRMNAWLSTTKFVARDEPSIADLSLACETSMLALLPDAIAPDIPGKYPQVAAWMASVQALGGGAPWRDTHAVLTKVVTARRAKL